MKKIVISFMYIFLIYIIGIQDTFATGETYIRATESVIVGNTTGEYAGNIIFSSDVNTKTIPSTSNKWAYIGDDNKFYGYFWIEYVGWATFNSGTTSYASLSGTSGTVNINGYAWSENAGWISFVNGVNNVQLNTTTGKFSGFAWSENLGWIDIASISGGVDITPPTFDTTIFAADHNKSMTINETNFLSGTIDTFNGENYGYSITSTTPNLDFRKSSLERKNSNTRLSDYGGYLYILEDKAGNKTTGKIHVTANVPSSTLHTSNISSTLTGASIFPSSSAAVIADGDQTHPVKIELRDAYGNPVVNDTVAGKTVTVNVTFENQINQYQYPTSSPLYVAPSLGMINFTGKDFSLNKDLANMIGTTSGDPDGKYNFDISSYAPTINGGTGSLKLTKFEYVITGVGGITNSITTPITYNFSPAFGVNDMTVAGAIVPNYPKFFTGSTFNSGTISSIEISHIFDITNPTTLDNIAISFQNPTGTFECNGFYKQNGYIITDSKCRYISNLSSNTFGSDNTFSWTPKLNGLPAPTNMSIKYSSLVTYKHDSGPIVGHRSFENSNISSLTNNQIKVTGITSNSSKNMITESGSTNINIIGTINKYVLKTTIYKNVELLTKNGIPTSGKIEYKTNGDYTLGNWPSGKDTIIVKGHNVYINSDIEKIPGQINGIVVLKDSDGNGGNIYIKDNVKFVAAVIYADGGLISGDGTTFYADSATQAPDQMVFKGAIASNNTIGGSFKNPVTCPYGVTPCTEENSKRYDLNLFRHFIYGTQGTSFTGHGIDMNTAGYQNAPIIIEYDSDIQKNPPAVFMSN